MRILKKNSLLSVVNGLVVDLAAPVNLSSAWNFGSLLGLTLVVQIVTGILLAGRYTASDTMAFSSIDAIMREVSYGSFVRYAHAVGAGFFLSLAYIHIARGLYYSSYKAPRQALWLSGVILFLLLMGTAFLGYVLVWSSMSFWAAIVITNLLGAIPVIGADIVQWIWAGFSVGNPTLVRFFSIHYLLPFVVAGLSIIHLALLHEHGSSNSIGVNSDKSKIRFAPYFSVKDTLGIVVVTIIYGCFVLYEPDVLNHADAFEAANPLVTPASIVPEFYFLPFYCLLRAIPNKLGGVIVMVSAIIILVTLCATTNSWIKTAKFKALSAAMFWIFCANFLFIGWLGQMPAEEPYVALAQIGTIIYFAYFITVLPLGEAWESVSIFGASLISHLVGQVKCKKNTTLVEDTSLNLKVKSIPLKFN